MKMKERKKTTAVQKTFRDRKDFIMLYQKIGWADFDELWDNDFKLNESTNSLINKQIGWDTVIHHM